MRQAEAVFKSDVKRSSKDWALVASVLTSPVFCALMSEFMKVWASDETELSTFCDTVSVVSAMAFELCMFDKEVAWL